VHLSIRAQLHHRLPLSRPVFVKAVNKIRIEQQHFFQYAAADQFRSMETTIGKETHHGSEFQAVPYASSSGIEIHVGNNKFLACFKDRSVPRKKEVLKPVSGITDVRAYAAAHKH
jgi:hypothetical protein